MIYLKVLFLVAALFANSFLCFAQQDYKKIFNHNWSEAELYAKQHRHELDIILSDFDVSSDMAEAVIFPELLRYSALKDFMETAAVKALYVKNGSAKSNFSIGRFQMKPSFAEEIERAWMKSDFPHRYEIYFNLSNNIEERKARILRLDDPFWQSVYLAMFIKLLYTKFPELSTQSIDYQVRFCATSYNISFTGSYNFINSHFSSKYYHTDFLPNSKTTYYSYCDIASFYHSLTFPK